MAVARPLLMVSPGCWPMPMTMAILSFNLMGFSPGCANRLIAPVSAAPVQNFVIRVWPAGAIQDNAGWEFGIRRVGHNPAELAMTDHWS
jgi:hypothetical protein